MESSRNVSEAEIDAELAQINEHARREAAQKAENEAGREPAESIEFGEDLAHYAILFTAGSLFPCLCP